MVFVIRFRQQFYFFCIVPVFGTCGFVCFSIGFRLSEQAYLVWAYGWQAVNQGLHVVRDRPVIVVSNGDQLGEPIRFLVFVGGAAMTFVLLCLSIELSARITALLGRRIQILAIASRLSNDSKHVSYSKRESYLFILLAILSFGLIFLLMGVITEGSLANTVYKYTAFLVTASFSLRLLFWNAPRELLRHNTNRPGIPRADRRSSTNSS